MRFKYRNIKTGAEFESNCEISAPNYEKLEAETPIAPDDSGFEPEDLLPESMADVEDIIKPDEPKPEPKVVKKSAKKPVKKGAKK